MAQTSYTKDLGGGLVLRQANQADTEALVEFNARIHGENPQDAERVGVWTRDLMLLPHPTFQPGDFTVVVDETAGGKIVSSMNLISQSWTYAGIPFKVGRPELVGTDPEYRNRGLVRAQFELVHQWSAERGEIVQAITGIPYYYRIFGYEMGLNLGGGRAGFKAQLPKLEEGKEEPYRVRPAKETDLALISQLYQAGCQRSLIACTWSEELWRYELNGKSEKNVNRFELRVIETAQGERAGFLAHPINTWGKMLVSIWYEVAPGVSMAAVTPSIVRYLYATGEAMAELDGKKEEFDAFGFWMGSEHPVYQVLNDALPRVRKPYSWYVRVADLPGFIHHIAPVLEQRLCDSPYEGHTGELKITFYRSGLRLAFDKGKLTTVENWRPEPVGHSGTAAFPELTFLQLVFGYRTLDELKYTRVDCWTDTDEAHGLLNAMFPKQASDIWPVA